MPLGFQLKQEQSQKLIMTPELRQAIAILQLATVELNQYVDQEMLENPVLELKEHDNDEELQQDYSSEKEETDTDWQEYFQDKSDLGLPLTGNSIENNRFENNYAGDPGLHEHLLLQLTLQRLSPKEQKIGEFIIGNIDEKGYLQCTDAEVAERYHVDRKVVEKVVHLIQSFDPAGVGARNLPECLQIQAEQLGIYSGLLGQIIHNHLNDLADSGINKVARALKVSAQEVQRAADLLKTLDPKPGRRFDSINENRYIVPDIVIERVHGDYIILVNDSATPRLRINNSYRQIICDKGYDSDTRKFVEGKLNSASWLIKSIEQRRLTLYKVAQALVKYQKEFLDSGIKHLKPLTMAQLAAETGLHESTISRAAANKYIQTPQGVFEIKYFFGSGLNKDTGSAASSTSIKKIIKEMVQNEDAKKPLSDPKIADILNQKGINISRRTVAKYRDEMGIFPSSKRKRY